MFHNKSVSKTRKFSVRQAVITAALAVLSASLVPYTLGMAAPALHIATADAFKVDKPMDGICVLRTYSLAEINAMPFTGTESCSVVLSTSLSALDAMKLSSAGRSDVDPLSFSVAALKSMRWRSGSSTIPTALQRSRAAEAPSLAIETAIYNSWRSAASNNSTNPLSFSVAALEIHALAECSAKRSHDQWYKSVVFQCGSARIHALADCCRETLPRSMVSIRCLPA